MKIKEIYKGNDYGDFIRFCEDAGYETMEEIESFDIKKISQLEGIGTKKYQRIKELYENYFKMKSFFEKNPLNISRCKIF